MSSSMEVCFLLSFGPFSPQQLEAVDLSELSGETQASLVTVGPPALCLPLPWFRGLPCHLLRIVQMRRDLMPVSSPLPPSPCMARFQFLLER